MKKILLTISFIILSELVVFASASIGGSQKNGTNVGSSQTTPAVPPTPAAGITGLAQIIIPTFF